MLSDSAVAAMLKCEAKDESPLILFSLFGRVQEESVQSQSVFRLSLSKSGFISSSLRIGTTSSLRSVGHAMKDERLTPCSLIDAEKQIRYLPQFKAPGTGEERANIRRIC